jgi:hypothetical protein
MPWKCDKNWKGEKNPKVSDRNAILRVTKSMKPPLIPQCRPMKDFFGMSGTMHYDEKLTGSDVSGLLRWIKTFTEGVLSKLYKTLWVLTDVNGPNRSLSGCTDPATSLLINLMFNGYVLQLWNLFGRTPRSKIYKDCPNIKIVQIISCNPLGLPLIS